MQYYCKEENLLRLSKNMKVLHLGCVGFADMDTVDRVRSVTNSLHHALSKVSDATGIDYSNDAIQYYKENNIFTNIIFGNVEKLKDISINDTFDVIVAGDIIEHISNPGLMLEGIKKFCNINTIILLTTPNAFGLMNYIRFALGKFLEGNEHVMTFNEQNISNLIKRHGYTIISIDTCYQKTATSKTFFRLGKLLFKVFPKFGGTLFLSFKYMAGDQSS